MGLKTRNVVLIGAGHVGSHCAYALAVQGIADEIVLVDLNEKKADAQAQDIADISCYLPHHIECRAGSYSDSRDADIVVICAGPLPAVNQSRLDTLADTVACIGGAIAGLGGLYFVMEYTGGTWANNGFGDRGWLAVALVIFARWKPLHAVWGALLFGALYILYLYIPGLERSTQEIFKMLPYLVTVLVLVLISLRKKKEDQPPESLGLAYFREDR